MASLARASRIKNPALFICDIQDKFRSKIYEFSKLVATTDKMIRASNALQIPIYITTQSRTKLGTTVPELAANLTGPNIRADIDKTLFSMITPRTRAPATQPTARRNNRRHRDTHLRDTDNTRPPRARTPQGIALARLRDAGAIVTSSESVLFEILGDAGHAQFKAVTGLVKETSE
ncbi:hypothetical protein N7533_007562, partial [Penicillium manginii]|uniref:uncharacterized protein n=1 Tax=Penicillium manginii TaxID=203109 RepID=UPI00254679D2